MSRRESITMRSKGNFLGYNVNTTGHLFPRKVAKVLRSTRSNILKDLRKMLKKRVRDRIPKLRTQLRQGFKGGNFRGTPIKRVEGTEKFETTVRGSHTVHIDITNIWSRLVSTRGMYVKVFDAASGISVSTDFYHRRDEYIKFYFTDGGTTPRISTVAERLDDTCLRFIENGNFDLILSQWGMFNLITLEGDIIDYLEDRKKALKGT